MIYSIFPTKDVTLFEKYPEMNTGIDEVLTIEKISSSSVSPVTYNSRALLKFDIDWTKISDSWNAAYLNMYVTEEKNIGADYKLVVHSVTESWDQGLGRAGHSPKTNVGASWKWRDKVQMWTYAGGVTSPSEIGSQIFSESKDLRINVSESCAAWSSSTYVNNGLMVRRTGSQETDAYSYGSTTFFGKDTHTIYPPRLEICWDDKYWDTSGLTALNVQDPEAVFFYLKNNRGAYKRGSKIRFNINGREKYPVKTYGTTSAELDIKRVLGDR